MGEKVLFPVYPTPKYTSEQRDKLGQMYGNHLMLLSMLESPKSPEVEAEILFGYECFLDWVFSKDGRRISSKRIDLPNYIELKNNIDPLEIDALKSTVINIFREGIPVPLINKGQYWSYPKIEQNRILIQPEEAAIVTHKFGLSDGIRRTWKDVAMLMGVDSSSVTQRESRIRGKFRHPSHMMLLRPFYHLR